MSPDSSKTEEMKTRIITHMNRDHASSLAMYLRHYCSVPFSQIGNAQIEDITTDYVILTSAIGRNVIPFTPPMSSLSESRERLVAMHKDALQGLDLSDIVVKEYRPPTVWYGWLWLGFCGLVLATHPFRSSLLPESGSWIASIWSLGGLVPGLARLSYTLQPLTLGFVVLTHICEAIWLMGWKRLRRHQVPIASRVWTLWILDNLVEGFAALMRFNEVVREIEEKNNSKKH